MAQICTRNFGDLQCPFHPGQTVALECEHCSGTLVCTQCVIFNHRGHTFRDLRDSLPQKVEKIEMFISDSEAYTLPKLEEKIKELTVQMHENQELSMGKIDKVKQHGVAVKLKIDKLINDNVSKFEAVMNENTENFLKCKTDLENLKENMMSKIKDCKSCLKSGSDIKVFDLGYEIAKYTNVTIPHIPEPARANFSPHTDPGSLLEKAFGEVVEHKISQFRPNTPIKPSNIQISAYRKHGAEASDFHTASNFKQGGTASEKSQGKETFSTEGKKYQLKVLSKFKPSLGITIVCPTLTSKVWACNFIDDKVIQLINTSGAEQQKLTLDVRIQDICTHPVSGKLYCCSQDDNSVRQINTKKVETTIMFHVESGPWCISVTKNSNIVIGMTDKICLFNTKGKLIYCHNGGFWPHDVSVCSNTNNVAVACASGGVFVLGSRLQKLYTYQGNDPKHEFWSDSIVFDANSNLLVGTKQYKGKGVHLLNGTSGKYIRTLHTTEMSDIQNLALQADGVLWVVCRSPDKIIRIQIYET